MNKMTNSRCSLTLFHCINKKLNYIFFLCRYVKDGWAEEKTFFTFILHTRLKRNMYLDSASYLRNILNRF